MANPVVATTQASTATAAASITVTFPSGLTAGDEMQIELVWMNPSASRTVTTPTDWTQLQNSGLGLAGLASYVKTATAGDVSAGSVSVSLSGTTDHIRAFCLRITGTADGSERTGTEQDSGAFPHTTALTPAVPETLVVYTIFGYKATGSAGSAGSASGYTTTPTVSFTEQHDISYFSGGGENFVFAVATGPYSGATQFTSRTVTITNGDIGSRLSNITIWNAPLNALGTAALLSADADFFAPSAVASALGTTALHTADADHFAPTAKGTAPTVWTPGSKPSTTWTPTNK